MCVHDIDMSAESRQCHVLPKCHMQCRDYFVSNVIWFCAQFPFFTQEFFLSVVVWGSPHQHHVAEVLWKILDCFLTICWARRIPAINECVVLTDLCFWHSWVCLFYYVCCTHRAESPMSSVFGERSRRSRCERISMSLYCTGRDYSCHKFEHDFDTLLQYPPCVSTWTSHVLLLCVSRYWPGWPHPCWLRWKCHNMRS